MPAASKTGFRLFSSVLLPNTVSPPNMPVPQAQVPNAILVSFISTCFTAAKFGSFFRRGINRFTDLCTTFTEIARRILSSCHGKGPPAPKCQRLCPVCRLDHIAEHDWDDDRFSCRCDLFLDKGGMNLLLLPIIIIFTSNNNPLTQNREL